MILTQQQRIDISRDLVTLADKVEDSEVAQASLEDQKDQLETSDNNLKLFFDELNLRIDSYFQEIAWLNGDNYVELTEANLISSAKKEFGNIFFPTDGSWSKFQPQANPPSNGDPIGSQAGDELEVLTDSIEDYGVLATIDFILNGQTSGVADDLTTSSYSGGNGVTINVTTGGQTIGNYLILDNGTDSALVKVTNTTLAPSITVDTIIAPVGTLLAGTTVRENIAGFSNADRQTLTPTFGANVLVGLKNILIQSVLDWEIAVNNQLTGINANTSAEVLNPGGAKEVAENTIDIIDTWQALPDSGLTGKLVDGNIDAIENEAIYKEGTWIPAREAEIVGFLGSVSSNPDGTYTGTGLFLERFDTINARINLVGGPLSEFYEKDVAISGLQQIIDTSNLQISIFENELLAIALIGGGRGTNAVVVEDASDFSISDSIFVVADGDTELSGTIQNIQVVDLTTTVITLSFVVPTSYTAGEIARLYKLV